MTGQNSSSGKKWGEIPPSHGICFPGGKAGLASLAALAFSATHDGQQPDAEQLERTAQDMLAKIKTDHPMPKSTAEAFSMLMRAAEYMGMGSIRLYCDMTGLKMPNDPEHNLIIGMMLEAHPKAVIPGLDRDDPAGAEAMGKIMHQEAPSIQMFLDCHSCGMWHPLAANELAAHLQEHAAFDGHGDPEIPLDGPLTD
jgi:hypothetical protein